MVWYGMGFSGGGARMPARSVCLVTLSLSEAGPGRFGGHISGHKHLPYHTIQPLRHYVFLFVFFGWFFGPDVRDTCFGPCI